MKRISPEKINFRVNNSCKFQPDWKSEIVGKLKRALSLSWKQKNCDFSTRLQLEKYKKKKAEWKQKFRNTEKTQHKWNWTVFWQCARPPPLQVIAILRRCIPKKGLFLNRSQCFHPKIAMMKKDSDKCFRPL